MKFKDFINKTKKNNNKELPKFQGGGDVDPNSLRYQLLLRAGIPANQIQNGLSMNTSPEFRNILFENKKISNPQQGIDFIAGADDLIQVDHAGFPQRMQYKGLPNLSGAKTTWQEFNDNHLTLGDTQQQINQFTNPYQILANKGSISAKVSAGNYDLENNTRAYQAQEEARKNELQNASLSTQTSTNNEEKKEPTAQEELDRLNGLYAYMMHDIDIPSAGGMLGQSLAFDSSIFEGHLQDGVRSANILRGVGAGVKLGTGVARSIFAGMGHQNRKNTWFKKYKEDIRDGQVNHFNFEEGGQVGIPDKDIQEYEKLKEEYEYILSEFKNNKSTEVQVQLQKKFLELNNHINYLKENNKIGLINSIKDSFKYSGKHIGNQAWSTLKDLGEFSKHLADRVFEEGGVMEGMSEEEMAQLQAMADQNGVSVEELLMIMQQQGQNNEQTQPTQGGMPSEEEIIALAQEYGVSPEEVIQMLMQEQGGQPSAFGQVQQGGQTEINPNEDANNISSEEAMVGDKRTGLAVNKEEANAEVEAKEWIKRINGVTQEVVGKSHEEGGELVTLDKGDIVISHALKLNKEEAERLSKDFGLKVKAGDSYADVLRKYSKESGLEELNQEQEKIFSKINKVREIRDENTNRLNMDFLSSQIREIESQKEELLASRSKLADILFDMQETSKINEGKSLIEEQPQGEVTEMEYGGIFEDERFKELAKRYNVDLDTAKKLTLEYLKNANENDKVPTKNKSKSKKLGASIDMQHNSVVKFGIDPNKNQGTNYSVKENYDKQAKDKSGITYGNGNIQQLEYMYDHLRDLFDENFELYDGQVSLKEGKTVKGYQEGYNTYLNNLYKDIVDEYGTDSQEAKDFSDLVTKINFTNSETDISRGIDNKLGQYTLSRMAFHKPVIHKEDEKIFEELGIYGQQSLVRNWDKLDDKLKDRYKTEYERAKRTGGNFNYTIIDKQNNTPTPEGTPAKTEEKKEEEKQEVPAEGEMKNNLNNRLRKNGLFYMPNQDILQPAGLTPHLKVRVDYEEIDPIKFSNEENMKEIGRTMDFASEQFSSMPDSQRALSLSNMIANSQENINKSTSQVAIANAQQIAQAEQYNAQKHDMEENAEAGNLLNYEQRQLKALDNTDDEWFNYLDYYRRLRNKNLQDYIKLANLNQIYDNYQINPFGVVVFNPYHQNQLTTGENRSTAKTTANVSDSTPDKKDKKDNKK